MKKLLTSLALAVGLAAPTVALPVITMTPADAGGSPCVTRTEFRNVSRGITEARVIRIFDSRGRTTYQGYGYKSKELETPATAGTGSWSWTLSAAMVRSA